MIVAIAWEEWLRRVRIYRFEVPDFIVVDDYLQVNLPDNTTAFSFDGANRPVQEAIASSWSTRYSTRQLTEIFNEIVGDEPETCVARFANKETALKQIAFQLWKRAKLLPVVDMAKPLGGPMARRQAAHEHQHHGANAGETVTEQTEQTETTEHEQDYPNPNQHEEGSGTGEGATTGGATAEADTAAANAQASAESKAELKRQAAARKREEKEAARVAKEAARKEREAAKAEEKAKRDEERKAAKEAAKAAKDAAKAAKVKEAKAPGVIAVIRELLADGSKRTVDELYKELAKRFPDRGEAMVNTIKCQLARLEDEGKMKVFSEEVLGEDGKRPQGVGGRKRYWGTHITIPSHLEQPQEQAAA